MRSLLYLPAAIFFLLPLISVIVQGRRNVRRQREAERRRAEKAEAAARIKAERDAQKAADKAAREAEATAKPKCKRGKPRREPTIATVPTPGVQTAVIPPVPVFERPASISPVGVSIKGNNAFAGQTVAFTGTLPGMTRREAIQAVQDNGGKAFETMPAGTTLLVVGDNPGMNKLNKADRWIEQVRKITPAQFNAMLRQPLTLTPDEFAAVFAAQN